jgi:lysine 6-dehydrogenase
VLDYYTSPSWILRDAHLETVEALSELEFVEFPEPVGRLEAFHTGGGISTMPWDFEGRIPTMEYKTLRYPGHAEIMRVIRHLGLLDVDPIAVDGTTVRPRDLFVALVNPKLRKPDAQDLVALMVVVSGVKGGAPRSVTFELLDYFDEEHGISAMERTTGYSLSVTGQMQVGNRVERFGVTTAYEGMPYEPYVKALAKRGIKIEERDSRLARVCKRPEAPPPWISPRCGVRRSSSTALWRNRRRTARCGRGYTEPPSCRNGHSRGPPR